MSCRGWSSDAYWAACISAELERAGHPTTLVCKAGSEARVIDRARAIGVGRVATLAFRSGLHAASDARDLRALLGWLPDADIVHVHRGKEHWLAAIANRFAASPRPIVRTRHIVQAVRPHALNRWLYGRATSLVVTVTEAIRRQYVAGGARARRAGRGLARRRRPRALSSGRRRRRLSPLARHRARRSPRRPRRRAPRDEGPSRGRRGGPATGGRAGAFHMVFVGAGALEAGIRRAIADAGLEDRVSMAGFVADLPAAIAAFDVALYAAFESDGMSRVLFEYLAMGKPVVATRVGVVPEVLEDGRTALLVPAEEPEPLTAAIERLLEDAGLRARLGGEASALARERLSGARVARALAALYARLPTAGGRTMR